MLIEWVRIRAKFRMGILMAGKVARIWWKTVACGKGENDKIAIQIK
jgi:hypothetical protein